MTAVFSTDTKKLFLDGKEVIKAWESYSGWYWFATEIDSVQDTVLNGKTYKDDPIYFGYVQGLEEEWGCFSEAELKSLGAKVWEIPKANLPYSGRRNTIKAAVQ